MQTLELLEQVRELQKVDPELTTEQATEIIRAISDINNRDQSLEKIQKGISAFDQLVQHIAHPEQQNVVLCRFGNKLIMVRAKNGKEAVEQLEAQLAGPLNSVRAVGRIYNGQDVSYIRTSDLGGMCNIPCQGLNTLYALQLKGVRYLTHAEDRHEAIERFNESEVVPSFTYSDSDIKELDFSQLVAVL